MSDTKIDPVKRAETIQNVRGDANKIFSRLDSWCRNANPPSEGICNEIEGLIDDLEAVINILAPNMSPPNRPVVVAYRNLKSAWSGDRNRINQWVQNTSWENCALAARKFKDSVAAWK